MRIPTFLMLLCLTLALATARAQEPVLDQLIDPISLNSDGNTLTVEFEDLRADTANTHYEVQQSDNITLWLGIPDQLPAEPLGDDRFRITAPAPETARKFYRILVYTRTAEDSDGDGLSDTFELDLNWATNPNLTDTDGDGFSDGVEFASGTDPLLSSSKPNDGLPPIAQFAESIISAQEGTPLSVEVVFDRSFSGTVVYEVVPRSSATAPDHFAALSGSLAVHGGSGQIMIDWVDDLEVQKERLLFLMLKEPADQAYIPGGRDFTTIRLSDNDAWWTGSLTGPPDSPSTGLSLRTRNFRVKLSQNASGQQVCFAAGTNQDGLPVSDGAPLEGSQSVGVIPEGTWVGTVKINSLSDFEVASAPIPIATSPGKISEGGSLFGNQTDLKRVLSLDATPEEYAYSEIKATRIMGYWTESVSSLSAPYLDRSDSGMFVLVKDIPRLAPLTETP